MAKPRAEEILEVQAKFSGLRKRAEALGIKQQDVFSLDSLKKYHPKEYSLSSYLTKTLLIILGIFLVVSVGGYVLVTTNVVSSRKVAKFVADYITHVDLDQDQCFVPHSELVLDYFRPPTECDFCSNVSQVEKISNLEPNDFVEKYAYSGRPVIITDATKNWTASDHFSFRFFKKVYKRGSPVLSGDGDGCQFFRYKTNFDTVRDVFRMPKEDVQMKGKPWYVGWSNCDARAADILRKYYKRPYFFPPELESSKTDWIFMGTPGYGAQMHIDNVQQSSWQAQIKGHKRWTIVPPPECYYKCPHGKIEVVVHPGEVIILDTNRWFHQTDIIGTDMSITIGSEYD